jgi:hypothetical protein
VNVFSNTGDLYNEALYFSKSIPNMHEVLLQLLDETRNICILEPFLVNDLYAIDYNEGE